MKGKLISEIKELLLKKKIFMNKKQISQFLIEIWQNILKYLNLWIYLY